MANWQINQLPKLSEQEFSDWQLLLERRTGINFDKHKHMLNTGLSQRLIELGIKSYREYYLQVSSGARGAAEWQALLKNLTIKETRFFRDPDAFLFVKEFLLDYLPSHNAESLEIWSAACSTGEEAYSLAITAHQCLRSLKQQKYFGVTATDICLSTLSQAKRGQYAKRKLEVIDDEMKAEFFEQKDSRYYINQQLKSRVCFVQANLVDLQQLPVRNMDVIFCHNVLIYFTKQVQFSVLDELVTRLCPGGVLIIGSAEAQGWQNSAVKKIEHEAVQAFLKCME